MSDLLKMNSLEINREDASANLIQNGTRDCTADQANSQINRELLLVTQKQENYAAVRALKTEISRE